MSEKQVEQSSATHCSAGQLSVAIKWLLLSNVRNRWPYSTNIRQEAAEVGMQWAIDNGFVSEGRITGAGEVWLMTH